MATMQLAHARWASLDSDERRLALRLVEERLLIAASTLRKATASAWSIHRCYRIGRVVPSGWKRTAFCAPSRAGRDLRRPVVSRRPAR